MTTPTGAHPIIDTHVHLDDAAFDHDRDAVIEASRGAGVRHFVNIGYSPESWEASRALRQRHADVDVVLGLHPQQAERFDPQLARSLSRALADLGGVAVGETGFDFARSGPGFEEQRQAFHGQLEIASAAGLPTIIHQRNAAEELMGELNRWPEVAPIVLHSFDGTQLLADWAIERGCFIGIGGLATRPGSGALRQLLSRMPVDRLLLETDAPYLSPPGAGGRRNTPANLPLIAGILAPVWGLRVEELCRATTANAVALFGLSEVIRDIEATGNGQLPESSTAHRHGESREDPRAAGTSAARALDT